MRQISIRKIGEVFGIATKDDFLVFGYQIDSRNVADGDLFFALSGQRADGHTFLEEVRKKGAVAAVVSREYQGPDFGLFLLRVDDVKEALQTLASALMQECKAEIIGITGSLGKTTTRGFIATLLSKKYKVYQSEKNYNTQLTYPLTLLNRKGDEEVLVVELGMTEPKDIARLVQICSPTIAVLTKVALVHPAYFEDLFDIAKNKADIFFGSRVKLTIFDHGLYEFEGIVDSISSSKLSFSLENKDADLFLSDSYLLDEKGVRAYQFDPPFKQPHILHNFLAALTVARAMKMSFDEINAMIPSLSLPKMRFEQYERGGVLFINDAYNANPESMRAALLSLPSPKEGGKKIAVLGMMTDMGKHHDLVHREIGEFARAHIDHLLVIGERAKQIYLAFQEGQKPAEFFLDFTSLKTRLEDLMREGDVVLFKASRLVEMENLLKMLEYAASSSSLA